MQARTMVVREYLVQKYKLDDNNLVTIGMGGSPESGDSGKIEILIYPARFRLRFKRRAPRNMTCPFSRQEK